MSKERELLVKAWNMLIYLMGGKIEDGISSINSKFLYELKDYISQPEQPEQITFKDDADKITHLENSVELLAGLLEDKKYVPLSDEDALKLFEEAEYLWFLEYKIGELKMQKQEQATTQEV